MNRFEQQRFTISEVAADWHELMIPCRWWTIGPAVQHTDIPPPKSATLGLHLVVRELLLISHPSEGSRLCWPEHTVGQQLVQGCLLMAWARFTPATWKLRVRYSTIRPLAPTEGHVWTTCSELLIGKSNALTSDHYSPHTPLPRLPHRFSAGM